VQGTALGQLGWQTQPATLRLEGHDLRSAAAPTATWILEVVRVKNELGWTVDESVLRTAVTLVGPPEAESVTVDLGDALPPGGYSASLSIGGGPMASWDGAFLLLPPPEVTGVDLPRVCLGATDQRITIQGRNLPLYLYRGDQVLLEDEQGTMPLWIEGGTGCTPDFFLPYLGTVCTGLHVKLPAGRGAGQARLTYQITAAWSPPPARNFATAITFETQGHGEAPGPIAVRDVGRELAIFSGGPIRVKAGAGPSVTLAGAPADFVPADCVDTADPEVRHCRTLLLSVPQGFTPGSHTVEVRTEAGCIATSPFKVVEPPVLAGFSPAHSCAGGQASFTVLGSGLDEVDWSFSAGDTGTWSPMPGFNLAAMPYGPSLVRATSRSTPPLVTGGAWLTRWPGPIKMYDRPYPQLVHSGATRPVRIWAIGAAGAVSGRLLPADGGAPIPVEVTSSGNERTLTFPAPGGDHQYDLELSDESPCGPSVAPYRLASRSDPVQLAWGFESAEQAPSLRVSAAFTDRVHAALSPEAGLTGAAATGWADADAGDWYLWLFSYVPAGDHGPIRFSLKATGEGAPVTAPGLRVTVRDEFGHYCDLVTDLPPPTAGVWTTYDVRLDDPARWTAIEPTGLTRPATAWDVIGDIRGLGILGGWWAGPGTVAVDDLSVELAR